jgi:hypothetical protein
MRRTHGLEVKRGVTERLSIASPLEIINKNRKTNMAKEKEVSPFRQEGESQQEYNERVPVAVQPVQPAPTTSYLGNEL